MARTISPEEAYNLHGGALNQLYNIDPGWYGPDPQKAWNALASADTDFVGQFKNLVGRDPTNDEIQRYNTTVIGNLSFNPFVQGRDLELSQRAANYIGTQYQDEANRVAEQGLAAQQGEANRLADLFQTQGNAAISDAESSLLDYQQRLFERLRPNLMTSLQAQGLLNTGGMNQAVVGAQADLANEGAKQVADLRLANTQAANDIRYAGASAPYQYKYAQIMNTPANLQAAQQTGLQNAYGTFMNQLNFSNQQALLNQQFALQQAANRKSGGFFKNLGSSLAPSLGTSLGNSLGQWFSPGAGQGAASNSGSIWAAGL